MDPGKVDRGVANPELAQGAPAPLQFRYTMATPFANVCAAFMRKFDFEAPNRLTTIERVEQLDDDRILMYRRHDIYNAPFTSYEQVFINRSNQSIESDMVGSNPDGSTYSTSKFVIKPNLASSAVQSIIDQYVYDVQGAGTGKIETFKNEVVKLQRAIKFSEWAEE